MTNMSQIGLSVINMSQYYGLEVLKYIKYIYKLHIKNRYILYVYNIYIKYISNMKGIQEH